MILIKWLLGTIKLWPPVAYNHFQAISCFKMSFIPPLTQIEKQCKNAGLVGNLWLDFSSVIDDLQINFSWTHIAGTKI